MPLGIMLAWLKLASTILLGAFVSIRLVVRLMAFPLDCALFCVLNMSLRSAISCCQLFQSKAYDMPPTILRSTGMAQFSFMSSISQSLDILGVILIDTGCSQHIFHDLKSFEEGSITYFGPNDDVRHISGIGGSLIRPMGVGTAKFEVAIHGRKEELFLKRALYCPELKANLISVSQLLDKGARIALEKHGCVVTGRNGDTIAEARADYGLSLLKTWTDHQHALLNYSSSPKPIERMWHERMAHLGIQNLRKLQTMSTGIDLSHTLAEDCTCEACLKGRMRDVPHREQLAKDAKHPYEIIFSDVEGKMPMVGHNGAEYFVTFTDAFTKESEIYTMKYRSEVPSKYRQYKASKERDGRKIRRLHADGAREYISDDFQLELANEGTAFSYSTAYSQQQNGVAERLNRTLVEKAASMMKNEFVELHGSWWPEAIRHANYLRNRSPVTGLDTTPIQAATGEVPDLAHIRVWGSTCWYREGSQKRFKTLVDDKANKGTLVGYESPHVFRVVNSKGKLILASSVHIQERFKRPRRDSDNDGYESDYDGDRVVHTTWFEDQDDPMEDLPHRRSQAHPNPHQDQPQQGASLSKESSLKPPHKPRRPEVISDYNLRSMTRLPTIPAHFALSAMPVKQIFSLLANVIPDEVYEPQGWKDAMSQWDAPQWLDAAKDEFNSLIENKTWTMVDRPTQRVLKGKWVFKYKRNALGKVVRYKARYVVKGYEQQYGVDYTDTFASVVKPMSYKMIFAIAAALDLEIEQMDVKTAFLYGDVEETVYVEQPEGMEDGTPRVCKLDKALYGLKQSPRIWYNTLSEFLTSLGFEPLESDHAVFARGNTFIAVYVDDLLIVGPDTPEIQLIKDALAKRFSMSDMGPIAFYLGMTITRDRKRRILRLGQRTYLEEGIRLAGATADPQKHLVPMSPTERLVPAGEEYTAQPEFKALYQSLVGTLMYAMLGSRPDIAYAVSCVSRYANNPTEIHMRAVKRIFSYLHGTLDYQLTYRGDLGPLVGYSDASWGDDPTTRRSTAGLCFNVGSGTISWSSKRQPVVSLSTCEAEYQAQTQTAKEAIWLKSLMRQLLPDGEATYATVIYCDNQGAMSLAKDPKFHPRTKHIDIQHHWIREKVASEEIELKYVETSRQMADGLTKPLPKDSFQLFRDALGLECVL